MAVNESYFYNIPETIYQVSVNLEAEQYEKTLNLEKRSSSVDQDLTWLEYASWLFRAFSVGNVGEIPGNPDFWISDIDTIEVATRVYNLRPL